MKQRQKIIRRVTWIGACLDGVLAFIKVCVGWLVHSPALIADGFHSLSDLLTDVAVVLFSHWASHAPDEDHPYGHHRYETLGTVILGTSLVIIASFIAWDSLQALFSAAKSPEPSYWAIAIATISIISKEYIFRYTLKAAKQVNSSLLEANAWHSRSDAFSSIVVLVGVIATFLGYAQIELIAAIFVAVLIGHMGVKLTWSATQDLVDRGLVPEEVEKIETVIADVSGVMDVHMLRSRIMGNHVYLDVHIQVEPFISVSEGHFIADSVMDAVREHFDRVNDITVHVDHEDDETQTVEYSLPARKQINTLLSRYKIEPDRLQIHYRKQRVLLELFFKNEDVNIQQLQEAMREVQKEIPSLVEYRFYVDVPNVE